MVGKIFIQPYVEDHSAQKLEVKLTFILKEVITHADCTDAEVSVTTQPEDQPLRNYLWLVRTLLAQHKSLQTGEVILTGSIIRPMDLKAGQYQFQVLGQQVSLKVT